ncbi:MAG: hypothetical protein M0R30_08250 [Methanoregula sp.]|jgi:hypothetical protein|uniref:COG1470 family protein n=1 Tax=Methanoregula sp. TaxID=2052170 RepID=UPI0025D5E56B|nr:hypothetical protein [Methanoregula sp.]MCK9631622.1 hypothetical protein [Methanoregula sp.]
MTRTVTTLLIAAVMLFFLIAAAGAAEEQPAYSSQAMQVVKAIPLPAPTPAAGSDTAGNYTKLEINPTYMQFALKPGESKEMTVTVRNRDNKAADLRPAVKTLPYNGPYTLDSSWITITPESFELPAGESTKFTVKVAAPADASRGSSSTIIAFTDEQYPSAYPTPYPNYIHQMNVNVNIVSLPAIQISPMYISDQVEAGKEYRYPIEIKNTGTTTVQLDPEISSDSFMTYGPYGPVEPGLTGSAFKLNAPSSIPPGATGSLEVVMNVPATATGYYNGYIDLGIDDPSLLQGEGRVSMNFNIWRQPPEPYVRKFTLDAAEPISIELTSGYSGYANPLTAATVREPSFETTLTGPEGIVPISPVQKVIKGTVSLSSDQLLSAASQEGTYQEVNTQYIVTYTAEGRPGAWQLSVMPKNAQSFEYTITLGKAIAGIPSLNLFPSPDAVVQGSTDTST